MSICIVEALDKWFFGVKSSQPLIVTETNTLNMMMKSVLNIDKLSSALFF